MENISSLHVVVMDRDGVLLCVVTACAFCRNAALLRRARCYFHAPLYRVGLKNGTVGFTLGHILTSKTNPDVE